MTGEVAPQEVLSAAMWCGKCQKLFCGKCCGLSRNAPARSAARCPECEGKPEWGKLEQVKRSRENQERDLQPVNP